MVIAVIGAQWGDEGKGKIVDLLAERFDVVVRYQGGHNAGHSVQIGNNSFVLHLLPSGIVHEGKTCVLGNGMVIDPKAPPVMMMGPSAPNGPPEPMEIAAESGFRIARRGWTRLPFIKIDSIASGIPCPRMRSDP